MSSIPVRKGAGVPLKRRSGSDKDKDHSPPHAVAEKKDTKSRAKLKSNEEKEKHRLLTRKELAEENDELKSEVRGQESRLKELETLLRVEKDKASTLKKEFSQKEMEYKDSLSDLNRKSEVLESKMETYETKLLKCNIDPVTLHNLDPEGKDSESETRYEQTMIKVKLIKEKFNELNLQAVQNIDSLQVMNGQLDDVLLSCQSITANDSAPGRGNS